ncbi:related to VTI1-v-SNARE: involved in Golgi retrograde protein traffic [Sporisorium scitamineum]|uniref:Related to VTI1-v-SNARE: involved in Golgi retrograde protein traffic n=2 Tax=Sporisorium scitamineum TaxID=49012 RepID=A0A127ZFZ4_9BASI|nr:related to VTI1-v-SNARE: involved in Golgi retrograde protein traffic [Sporisorium scitamineum]
MSELFDSYASDLQQLKQGIRQKIDQAKSQNGEAKKSTLRRAEMELEEADEVISQMDIEVQGFPQSVRSRFSVQIRGFKQEVQALTKEVRSSLSPSSSGGARGGYDPAYADGDADLEAADSATANRQRLLQGTASLEDGTRRLEESNRLALETEDLGADILRDLRSQREQIENSRDTLRQADQSIDRSSKTLSKMIRRAKQQKLVTVGIIVCLVLLILLILYNKLF